MKFIGQHIYDLISRFRNDIYLEDISTGTIASGSNLGLDSNNKIVKATEASGDLTGITAGTGLSGTDLTGPVPTLNVDASIPEITTLAGLTSIGAAGATTDFAAGDITMYNAVNNGNPTISLGSSATERLEIKAEYESGAQGLDVVRFTSFTAGSSADDARYAFEVDDAFLFGIVDGGIRIKASGFLEIGNGNAILSDSSGTTTLSNIDALDATTEATIEAAIDTLSNLTSVGTLTTLSVDDIVIDAKSIKIEGDTDDSFTITTGAAGATTLTTLDTAGTDGHLEIAADGNIILDAAGDIALECGGADLTCDAGRVTFESSTTTAPTFVIKNTTNDTTGAHIKLRKDKGAAAADGDDIGTILFEGDNAAQQLTPFASIVGEISTAADTDEAGKLTLNVAESDGSASQLSPGLILEGEHATDGQVDVTIANGAASTTTIAGTLTMGSTAAMTNAGLLSVANQTGITGVGTISSGTWQGTSIATTYTDAKVTSIVAGDGIDVSGATGDVTVTAETATDSNPGVVELATTAEAVTGTDTARAVTPAGLAARVSQIINLKGYVTLQNDVYDYANPYNSDDEAPFQLDTSYGSGTIDSSTEKTQASFMRSNGFHVPFACTVSALQVQASVNGSGGGNVTAALVEYRPSTGSGDQNDYPRTVYEEVNVAANNNNNKIATTTIAAGDLDATAVPAGSHLMIMVKGDSDTVGDLAIVSMSVGLSW